MMSDSSRSIISSTSPSEESSSSEDDNNNNNNNDDVKFQNEKEDNTSSKSPPPRRCLDSTVSPITKKKHSKKYSKNNSVVAKKKTTKTTTATNRNDIATYFHVKQPPPKYTNSNAKAPPPAPPRVITQQEQQKELQHGWESASTVEDEEEEDTTKKKNKKETSQDTSAKIAAAVLATSPPSSIPTKQFSLSSSKADTLYQSPSICSKTSTTAAVHQTIKQKYNNKKRKRKHSKKEEIIKQRRFGFSQYCIGSSSSSSSSSSSLSSYNQYKSASSSKIENNNNNKNAPFDHDLKKEKATTATRPFTPEGFEELWRNAEYSMGLSTEALERGKLVRESNNNMMSSSSLHDQTRAQYGRILSGGIEKIIQKMEISPSDIFLDIGHGIGNAPLQVAFTIGCCESRGIEIVEERCVISHQFKENLEMQLQNMSLETGKIHQIGPTELRHGSFTDIRHRNFLISATKILVNNANDIFGTRSALEGKPTLDAHIAGLFALSKPDTVMATLYPITGYLGCRSINEENYHRKKRGLRESLDASFFTCQEINLGTGVVSWSHVKEIKIWLYTRVHQSDETGTAYFLCDNVNCEAARNCIPTAAVECGDNEAGGAFVRECCVVCGVKRQVVTREGKKQQQQQQQTSDDNESDD